MTQTGARYRAVAACVVAVLLAHLLDFPAWKALYRDGVYDNDLGRLFRVIGYLPLWLLLGFGFWLQTRNRRRGLMIALVPALGGIVAEAMKILLRRERPKLHDGQYFFRPFSDQFWYTRDIGLPSSHALVAFSGAWLLCRIWPRAWPVWLFLAGGCALTRVQSQAHFLSDVTVAAVAAYWVVALVWKRVENRE